jgi:hypothetical protein
MEVNLAQSGMEVNLARSGMEVNPVQHRRETNSLLPKILGEVANGSKSKPVPRWCPSGITKTQRHMLLKMRQRELAEKRMEEERDVWFARARPMTKPNKTWREKRLDREEDGTDSSEGQGTTKSLRQHGLRYP